MSRDRVSFAQGGFYHIYNRGAGRNRIFMEEQNYFFLLRQLKQYARALCVTVIAYCLLPNHYHFLLRQDSCNEAGLLAQRVFNGYSKAFNRRYERTGTLLEGPYRAIPVTNVGYLLHLCRYIHGNPVHHGMVDRLEEWPYSNYPEWLGLREGTLWDPEFMRGHFSSRADYGRFVAEYAYKDAPLPEDLARYLAQLGQ